MCRDAISIESMWFLHWETGTESMDIMDTHLGVKSRQHIWGHVWKRWKEILLGRSFAYPALLCERFVHWEVEFDLDVHEHSWTATSVSRQAMSFQICKAVYNGKPQIEDRFAFAVLCWNIDACSQALTGYTTYEYTGRQCLKEFKPSKTDFAQKADMGQRRQWRPLPILALAMAAACLHF